MKRVFHWTKRVLPVTLNIVLACAGVSNQVQAENRALLIGVGEHQMAQASLIGIDQDLGMIREVAGIMGYQNSQIKVLQDDQATKENVEEAMTHWLTDGVSKDDSVLIYFSGHGVRVPAENSDEEARVSGIGLYDLSIVKHEGKMTLKGVLTSDVLSPMIRGIPSDNVLFLVDASHSGSIIPIQQDDTPPNFVTISATDDKGQSISTGRGSLFTQSVLRHVKSTHERGGSLTPRSIKELRPDILRTNWVLSGVAALFIPSLMAIRQRQIK